MYRLRAYLTSAKYAITELIEAKVPRYRKRGLPDQWHFTSDDLTTPLGLPLRIYVSINYKDRIQVDSGDTTLLVAAD